MTSKLLRYGWMAVGVGALLVGFQNFSGGGGKKVQMEGTLEVLHIHNTDKTTRYEYSLIDKSGKKKQLKFNKGKAPNLVTGTKIRVSGEESGNVLALDSSTGGVQVLALPAPNTFGEQKTLVMLVNFQDNQTQPYTASQVNSNVFGESSNFIKENSYGQTWLNGNVVGWYTLPIAQSCSSSVIADAARQAAAAAGVDLALYSRHIIVMPKNTSCSWSALGSVGGNPSTAWMNGAIDRHGITHEMGHNFGLWHSHSLECGATTLGSNCTRNEYGDWFDTMGAGEAVHFNAFQKERLGWLNYGVSPPIATIESGSGTFTLVPYATGSGLKAVKILKSIDITTGQKSWYYVEFRQPIGFDERFINYPYIINGVLVRMGLDDDGNRSDLLDMTPGSNTHEAYDWRDAPLAVGKSYVDSNGVTISLLSASSSGASVSVSLPDQTPTTASCIHAIPGIVVSLQSGSVAPGTPVSYTLTVTNKDDSRGCSSSVFNLGAVVPSGWSSNLASSSITLAPGSSGSTTLTVTSPLTIATGSYRFAASVTNGTTSGYSNSVWGTYSVGSGATPTPTPTPTPTTTPSPTPVPSLSASVVTDKPSYAKGGTVYITAQVLLNGNPASGASVSFAITKPDGSVVNASAVTDTSGKAMYKLRLSRKAVVGSYQVRINANSGGQSASAVTSFGVQ